MSDQPRVRNLVIVLGDQLDADSAAFDGFDPDCDAVLQMEVMEEATYVRQHKKRIAFFFSAMRHFRGELEARGRRVYYVDLEDQQNTGSIETEIERMQRQLEPETVATIPGKPTAKVPVRSQRFAGIFWRSAASVSRPMPACATKMSTWTARRRPSCVLSVARRIKSLPRSYKPA